MSTETSWREKRENTLDAIERLPSDLRAEAQAGVHACKVTIPATEGMQSRDSTTTLETMHFTPRFDPSTGAIVRLRNKHTGVERTSVDHPLALFTYQTLSPEEYAA